MPASCITDDHEGRENLVWHPMPVSVRRASIQSRRASLAAGRRQSGRESGVADWDIEAPLTPNANGSPKQERFIFPAENSRSPAERNQPAQTQTKEKSQAQSSRSTTAAAAPAPREKMVAEEQQRESNTPLAGEPSYVAESEVFVPYRRSEVVDSQEQEMEQEEEEQERQRQEEASSAPAPKSAFAEEVVPPSEAGSPKGAASPKEATSQTKRAEAAPAPQAAFAEEVVAPSEAAAAASAKEESVAATTSKSRRDSKHNRDSKSRRDSKDNRGSKSRRDSKDNRGSKSRRDSKDNRESKSRRDSKASAAAAVSSPTGPQKKRKTRHVIRFRGTEWEGLLESQGEELRETVVSDITNCTGLSESNIRDLELSIDRKNLVATFFVIQMVDEQAEKVNIHQQMREYDYPLACTLYLQEVVEATREAKQ